MPFLRCLVQATDHGTIEWIPEALMDGRNETPIPKPEVAFINHWTKGIKEERRDKAPFYSLIPCPYCGTKDDRRHDPSKHVDPRFGILVEKG